MSIKVGLYGMDERSIHRLVTVFKMVYKGECVPEEISKANTVIVDLDNNNYESQWQSFREAYPDKPAVILADVPIEVEDCPFVSKPARLPELLEAIRKTSNVQTISSLSLSSNNKTHHVADSLFDKTNKNSSSTSTAPRRNGGDIYYRPEKFLQGKVTEAVKNANKKKESVFIRCWSDRWIIVSPGSEYILENIKDHQLRKVGLDYIDDEVLYRNEPLSDKQIEEMANTPTRDVKSTPICKFVWDVTVRTARGRVPEGTSLEDLYVLSEWPNLTRLARIPNSMRISAFWVDQPQSINNVKECLDIPLEDVLTFFSAASASGLLTLAKRKEDKLVTPQVVKTENKKQGILSAIMRKITKHSTVDEDAA